MLSFFRSKSGETGVAVDKLVNGTENLAIKTNTIQPSAELMAQDPNALFKSLGYQNAVELKETIYGEPRKNSLSR